MSSPYPQPDLDPNVATHQGSHLRSADGEPPRHCVLTLLAHPDPRRVGERAVLESLDRGQAVFLSRLETLFHGPDPQREPLPIADHQVSRARIRLESAGHGGIRIEVPGDRITLHVGRERIDDRVVIDAERLEQGEVLLLAGRVALLLRRTTPRPLTVENAGLLGLGTEMHDLRADLLRAARTDLPVLLLGESGTGKELAARAVHQHRIRDRQGPFEAVHLAALPTELVAAELFGVSKGAFTSAEARKGCFARAEGGTLFLDEIGELPVEVQVQLLRVLEERRVRRLGDGTSREIDVRIVSATDAELERAVDEGKFRLPLYQRLCGYEIHLPPLRRRREDTGLLFYHFLRQELRRHGAENRLEPVDADQEPFVPAALVARLTRYSWPGNVRELRNLAARLAGAHFDQPRLHLPENLLREPTAPTPRDPSRPNAPAPRETEKIYRDPTSVTDEELIGAIEAEGWNYQKAAEHLCISKTTLYRLVERCPAIRKGTDLGEAELRAAHEKHGGDLAAMASDLKAPKKGIRQRLTELGLG